MMVWAVSLSNMELSPHILTTLITPTVFGVWLIGWAFALYQSSSALPPWATSKR